MGKIADTVLVSVFFVGPVFFQEALVQVSTDNVSARVVTGIKRELISNKIFFFYFYHNQLLSELLSKKLSFD